MADPEEKGEAQNGNGNDNGRDRTAEKEELGLSVERTVQEVYLIGGAASGGLEDLRDKVRYETKCDVESARPHEKAVLRVSIAHSADRNVGQQADEGHHAGYSH